MLDGSWSGCGGGGPGLWGDGGGQRLFDHKMPACLACVSLSCSNAVLEQFSQNTEHTAFSETPRVFSVFST